MWEQAFKDEFTKSADLISKTLFNKMDSYDQKRVIGARDTIAHATSESNNIPQNVREKMIEAAFDSLKGMSWSFARAGSGKTTGDSTPEPSVSKPKKKYVL